MDLRSGGLGTYLLEAGLITQEQLDAALQDQKQSGERLGAVLVRQGAIAEDDLARALSRQLKVPLFDPGHEKVSMEALTKVPADLARRHRLLPLSVSDGTIRIVFADPLDLDAIDDLRLVTGLQVKPLIGAPSVVDESSRRHYARVEGSREVQEALHAASLVLDAQKTAEEELDEDEAKKRSEDAPIINLVNQVIAQAMNEGATDIHVEPLEAGLVVRYRVDGLLYDALQPPKAVYTGVVTRIKILADMDISERRAPQGGRFTVRALGKEVDVRVSSIPTIHGEKVVMRLLHKTDFNFSLGGLGFEKEDLEAFSRAIKQPYGMVLLSGPTGSGKSTTLYAGLRKVVDDTLNVMTVEDPVEYHMPRVNQVQVNEKKGVTFASCLRTFLRQDPDVIMVGEIRDADTAEIAVRAAMTGHMVFSTIHANDAPSTAIRLVSLGAEPFQAASAMTLVAAQRLVRRVCPHCARPYDPPEEQLFAFGLHRETLADAEFRKGEGCEECKYRGFRGRTAIVELMPLDREIRDLVAGNAPADRVREAARKKGMRSLKESGLAKALRGETTVEEVLRVCLEQE